MIMSVQEKMEIITRALELEVGDLQPETVLADMENWDSMARLQLIAALDEECGKELPAEQVKAFRTVGDILAFMD